MIIVMAGKTVKGTITINMDDEVKTTSKLPPLKQ